MMKELRQYAVKFEVVRKTDVARTIIDVSVVASGLLEAIEQARAMLTSGYEYKFLKIETR